MKLRYQFSILIIIISVLMSRANSQVLETKSLSKERSYQSIEIALDKSHFEFLYLQNIKTSQLFLYAFHSNSGWEPIPFQIDEANPYTPSNDIMDTTDVLIFLAQDLGDKVTLGNWINNPEAQANKRFEIEVFDPNNNSQKGWCYLFVSATMTESDKSPIKYVSFDTTQDQFRGKYYQLDFGEKWYPQNIRVTSEGDGTNQDFYDRTKLRLILQLGQFPYTVIEDSLLIRTDQPATYTPNSIIRLKRELKLKMQPFNAPMKFTMTFHPYSTTFSGEIGLDQYVGLVTVKKIRMTYDLNASATGMRFYSGDINGIKNQAIPIDGNNYLDNVDTSLVKNKKNWTMVTGNVGTMITINDIRYESNPPKLPPEPYYQYLYYWDDKTGGTLPSRTIDPQNDWDTGDSTSYGDHGMAFESNALTDSLHYISTTYYLGRNQPTETAQNMFRNLITPLFRYIHVQDYLSRVSHPENSDLTRTYRLTPNFPNPFNSNTSIRFDLPKDDHVWLAIYDVQGKHIVTLVDNKLTAGSHPVVWNGRDKNNNLVASGIYICKMQTDIFHAAQKMVLVK